MKERRDDQLIDALDEATVKPRPNLIGKYTTPSRRFLILDYVRVHHNNLETVVIRIMSTTFF